METNNIDKVISWLEATCELINYSGEYKGVVNGAREELAALKLAVGQEPSSNTAIAPCQCITKSTGVPNMYLLFPRAGCPYHGEGKLWRHGASC